MKRMSFAATKDQMYRRTKTVTRRHVDTWKDLQPGDLLMAVEKAQGLPKGQRQKCIHPVEILKVEVVPLAPISPDDVAAEGFRGRDEAWFLREVWGPLNGDQDPTEVEVRRIEFRHRADLWTPGFLPSNGTDGEWFRSRFCGRCIHDHRVHLDPDSAGDPGEGVCEIFTRALVAYPGPGPDEWESRLVEDPTHPAGRSIESRCSAFQECHACHEIEREAHEKVWPVEVGTAWSPKPASTVTGQLTLID